MSKLTSNGVEDSLGNVVVDVGTYGNSKLVGHTLTLIYPVNSIWMTTDVNAKPPTCRVNDEFRIGGVGLFSDGWSSDVVYVHDKISNIYWILETSTNDRALIGANSADGLGVANASSFTVTTTNAGAHRHLWHWLNGTAGTTSHKIIDMTYDSGNRSTFWDVNGTNIGTTNDPLTTNCYTQTEAAHNHSVAATLDIDNIPRYKVRIWKRYV